MVVLPLGSAVERRLSNRRFREGDLIERKEICRKWKKGRSLYVSCIVFERDHHIDPRELRDKLNILTGRRSSYARVSEGSQKLARQLQFRPFTGDMWVRTSNPSSSSTPHPSRRLANHDRSLARLTFAHRLMPLLLTAYIGAAILLAILVLDSPGWLTSNFTIDTALLQMCGAIAATVGGLSLTVFFFSAQQRINSNSQYGLTRLFRLRDLILVVLFTGGTIVFAIVASLIADVSDGTPLLETVQGLTLLTLGTLLAWVLLLTFQLVRNLDSTATGRFFASEIRGRDANEWGLVQVISSRSGEEPIVEIRPRRINFGLRDPMMTLHELILEANIQRYGQILGVITERIAVEYGCRWQPQYPDEASLWTPTRLSQRHRLVRRMRNNIAMRYGRNPSQERLQLVTLLMHYLVRIHRNDEVLEKVNKDYRRQVAQLTLSRLIFVLALTKRSPVLEQEELSYVLQRCVEAVIRIGRDYGPSGLFEYEKPRVENERMTAFLTAIDALEDLDDRIEKPTKIKHSIAAGADPTNSPNSLALDAARGLRWLVQEGAIDRARVLPTNWQHHHLLNHATESVFEQHVSLGDLAFLSNSPWSRSMPEESYN